MRLTALVLLIIMLLGCTHSSYPISVDGLKAQGYQSSAAMFTSDADGQFVYYQVWSKETRDDGRRVHLCVVPGWSNAGYLWRATAYVDGRETWNYAPSRENTGGTQEEISCVTTDPLPDGVLTWLTGYKYSQ